MSRAGVPADEAFASLLRMSRVDDIKIKQMAQRIVDEAVRRARARRARP